MKILTISTNKKDEVLDITGEVQKEVEKSKISDGLCHLFVLHTTCALTTADLDPGTDLDMLDALRKLLPEIRYRHPHNPSHAGSHSFINNWSKSYHSISE